MKKLKCMIVKSFQMNIGKLQKGCHKLLDIQQIDVYCISYFSLQALIGEKKLELERLRVQYDSLQRTEAEQLEFIEQFVMRK